MKPDGTRIHNFAWGLGLSSSIQAEALALFQGLFLKGLNIRCGDSPLALFFTSEKVSHIDSGKLVV
jgi:hypothetical protein